MKDQKSTNSVWILSTINFVCSLANKYSMTPMLTFNQPLYWKTMELQASFNSNNDIHNFVLRLGGFPMCMSFLGALGHLVQGSGVSSIFEQIYAELSVPAILSGKEMSRGGRRAQRCLLSTKVFVLNRETNFESECPDLPFSVQELKDMVSQLMSKDITENKLQSSRPFLYVVQKVKVFKESHSSSKTFLLWLQYMHAIEILLGFLKAERSSNWMLHL